MSYHVIKFFLELQYKGQGIHIFNLIEQEVESQSIVSKSDGKRKTVSETATI